MNFKFTELPNDMKMLAFLAGELTNSAKYFSSFADVTTSNGKSQTGTFGREENNMWKPWRYDHRLQVVKKVEAAKKIYCSQKACSVNKTIKNNRIDWKPEKAARSLSLS